MTQINKPITPERVKKETKKTKGDWGHVLITVGFSLIIPPPYNSIFTTLFGTVICPPPITWRMNQLMFDMAVELKELQMRGKLEIEELINDESFLSTLMHAFQIALRTHQKEKLEAIKNAILNSALSNAPEDDLKLLFLSYIDTFTTVHFKLLKFFMEKDKSKEWVDVLADNFPHESFLANGDSTSNDENAKDMVFDMEDIIKYEFPESCGFENLYLQVTNDLGTKSLITSESYHLFPVTITDHRTIEPYLQSLGEVFMEFITSPLDRE